MTKVDVRRLKKFAFSRLPKNSTLRDLILSEEDKLEAHTFLARLPIWLKLLEKEIRREND